MNIEYLVQLLKTPFMKYQIQVLASGSVRDNFSADDLLSLKIPDISKLEQKNRVKQVNKLIKSIKNHSKMINQQVGEINKNLTIFD